MAAKERAYNLFVDDLVWKVDSTRYECGLVMEHVNYNSDDDEYGSEIVRDGSVHVVWYPAGDEETVKVDKVKLCDRALLPGDTVRRLVQGVDSQRGVVTGVQTRCIVRVLGIDSCVLLHDVNCADIEPLARAYNPDNVDVRYIHLDSWVGQVESAVFKVEFEFSDGARCVLEVEDMEDKLSSFEDIYDKREQDSEFYPKQFYRGQVLRGTFSLLRSAHWLKSTRQHSARSLRRDKLKTITVTVVSVDIASLEVVWLSRGFSSTATDKLIDQPPRRLNSEQVKRVKVLDMMSMPVQIVGDLGYYTVGASDEITTLSGVKLKNIIHELVCDRRQQFSCLPELLNDAASASSVNRKRSTIATETPADPVAVTKKRAKHDARLSSRSDELDVATLQLSSLSDDDEGCHDAASRGGGGARAASFSSSLSLRKASRRYSKKRYCGGSAGDLGPSGTHAACMKKKKERQRKGCSTSDNGKSTQTKHVACGDCVTVEVIHTYSTADVRWQDGSFERAVPAVELFCMHYLDDLEFFPGDFVSSASGWSGDRYGIVESCLHADRTCIVRWMTIGPSGRPTEQIGSEEVTVYDIRPHYDYRFRPKDIVTRITVGEDGGSGTAGVVCSLALGGLVPVVWEDGSQTLCVPQEICFVASDDMGPLSGGHNSEEEEDEDDLSGSSSASWETEEEVETVGDSEPNADTLFKRVQQSCLIKATNLQAPSITLDVVTRLWKAIDLARGTYSGMMQPLMDDCTRKLGVALDNAFQYSDWLDNLKMLNVSHMILSELLQRLDEVMQVANSGAMTMEVNGVAIADWLNTCVKDVNALLHPSPSISPVASLTIITCMVNLLQRCGAVNSNDALCDSHTLAELDSTLNAFMRIFFKLLFYRDRIDAIYNDSNVLVEINVSAGGGVLYQLLAKFIVRAKKLELCLTMYMDELIDFMRVAADTLRKVLAKHEITNVSSDTVLSDNLNFTIASYETFIGVYQPRTSVPRPMEELSNQTIACVQTTEETNPQQDTASTDDMKASMLTTVSDGNRYSVVSGESHTTAIDDSTRVKDSSCTVASPIDEFSENISNERVVQNRADDALRDPLFPVGVVTVDSAPACHKFLATESQPVNFAKFLSTVRKEIKTLKDDLPHGIFVKTFADRMDLYSVLIAGPTKTPYEDLLFVFDVKLPNDYPVSPPQVYYHPFCTERLNPNLYEDGKVCLSLLGTWSGKGTETWTSQSNLLQLFLSIQGLILVPEPYFNEAGFEGQRGSVYAAENSRMYNEMVVLKVTEALGRMLVYAPIVFRDEIMSYLKPTAIMRYVERLNSWLDMSRSTTNSAITTANTSNPDLVPSSTHANSSASASDAEATRHNTDTSSSRQNDAAGATTGPAFPFFPISRGFLLALGKKLDQLCQMLNE